MPQGLSFTASVDSIAAANVSLTDMAAQSRSAGGGKSSMRLRTLNLVVRCDSEEHHAHALELISRLSGAHPSRTIFVLAGSPGGPPIRATVARECEERSDRILCYDLVSVETGIDAVDHLNSVVQPLLVSHLPVCLWWVGEPAFSHDAFEQLAVLSHSVIIDSQCFVDAQSDLIELDRLLGLGRTRIVDLNWQRTGIWRELIAQMFSSAEAASRLPDVSTVAVVCDGGHPMQALLTLGWLASRLAWTVEEGVVLLGSGEPGTPRAIELRVERGGAEDGTLASVRLVTSAGGTATFTMDRSGDDLVTSIEGDGLPGLSRTNRIAWPSEADLLRRSMSVRAQDAIFANAVHAAAKIAPLLQQ